MKAMGTYCWNGGNLSDRENNRTIEEPAARLTVNANAAFQSALLLA
ncbi:hypothetical protein O9992_30885 [Vibrio lentus]|nr:hypothetical protein [Vibrio lentus]